MILRYKPEIGDIIRLVGNPGLCPYDLLVCKVHYYIGDDIWVDCTTLGVHHLATASNINSKYTEFLRKSTAEERAIVSEKLTCDY